MSLPFVACYILILGCVGFLIALKYVRSLEQEGKKMHSRAVYYGWRTLLLTSVPSLLFLILWQCGSIFFLEHLALKQIRYHKSDQVQLNESLILSTVNILLKNADQIDCHSLNETYGVVQKRLAEKGEVLPAVGQDFVVKIACNFRYMQYKLHQTNIVLSGLFAIIGLLYGLKQIKPHVRARNKVEFLIKCSLILMATLAILTTIGIVFSLVFETISFFRTVPMGNFFFGTVWDPRFSSVDSQSDVGQFGFIPLLAGTLYIAFVAMFFAVPIGLFCAIYMSEYASSRARAIIKPLLEVLAGIPTIVYGFFALITVGPFLRDLSAVLGGGHSFIMAQSVLTAGLVMGVMLIPFVSSLADDIISAVPRAMREGSYGLGATQSETIKKVVLPAALPGVIGALLLTASRAVGETMIVVLAAGVMARLTLNPFDNMTTITVKIVNQLTGDLEFNSPQTLVAFALGITLFVLTLLMNIYAVYIVRKYREQYE